MEGIRQKVSGDAVHPVEYAYDAYGRMTNTATFRAGTGWNQATWPAAPGDPDNTAWQYDIASGLMTNKVYADGSSVGHSYTVYGKLSTRTWARTDPGTGLPLQTLYSYDPNTAELLGVDYSDSTPDVSYTYDRLGRQATVIDGEGTRTFTYNTALQLDAETMTRYDFSTYVIDRQYDTVTLPGRYNAFNLTLNSAPDPQYNIGYEFDTYGRMNVVSGLVGVASALRADYSYLANSDLISGHTVGDLSVTRSYEAQRNLIASIENTFDGNSISQYDYLNDSLGRRTNRTDTLGTDPSVVNGFAYNTRSELTNALMNVQGYAYSFDTIGNRLASTNNDLGVTLYSANDVNEYTQLTTDGSPSDLFYDLDGSLTNDDYWAFEWNGENRLISAVPVTPTNGAKKVEFAYDYQGRRVSKKSYTFDLGLWILDSSHTFVYDGWLLISENICNLTSTITNSYLYGLDLSGSLQGAGGVGGLVALVTADDTYVYCMDANGNVVQMLDASDGSVEAEYEYSPFGKLTSSSGAMADENPFRFSSKYQDTETALYYYGFRFYDASLGRWLSRDPLGEEGGLLLYCACGNNMINGVDPVGLTFVLDPNMSVEDRARWRRIIGRFRSTYHGEKMFLHLHVYTKKKIYIYFTKAKPNEDAKALAGVDNYGHDAIFLPNTSRFEDFAHETQHKAEQLCPSKSLDPLDEGLVSEFDPPEDAMPYDTSENRADRFANIVAHEYYSYTPDIKSRSDLRPMPFDPKVDHPIPGSENKRVIPEPYGTKYEGYKYRVGSDEMLMFIEKLQIKRDEIRAEARAAMAAGKEK